MESEVILYVSTQTTCAHGVLVWDRQVQSTTPADRKPSEKATVGEHVSAYFHEVIATVRGDLQ